MPHLKTLRDDHCLTHGDLAALPGIRRQQTMSDWERGAVRPRLRQWCSRCAVLNVTSAALRAARDAAAPYAQRQDQHHA
jgi:DNA-binding XRE family transcriptional regulator